VRKIGLLIIAILFIASTLLFVVIKTYGSERVLYFALAKVDKNLASQVRKIIERSSLNSLRVYIDYHRGKVINFKSDGLKIVGTLYGANTNSSVQKPAIVLLNGRSLYGRKLPLYRILSQKLADRGYIVLSIDLRGFGESDNPNPVDEVESWAEWDDVQNAISYLLKSRGDVDISKIYVVGHSHGSHIAVVAGIRDDRIKKIVAIGPSPHNREELMSKDFLERFSRDRGLKQILPAEVVFSIISSFIIQNNFDYFTHTPHKPILLIKGEAENEETKLFLKGIYDQMVEPKRYVIIPKSDHYMNTTRENTIVIYNKDTINEVVDLINGFLKANIN
jgi:pimeloyl-ACP methyl ester carboxylesterase